jgi:radical SAM superfamily enzyme YgiQ (UPF0313 family)
MSTVTLVNLVRSSRPDERLLPLGCLHLRAALEAAGHAVDLRDLQFLDDATVQDPDALAPLLDDSAAVVGLSLMVDALPLAVALARRLKERRPERTLVLGGAGPGGVSAALVADFPWLDVVVRGEGEQTLPAVVAALEAGTLAWVPGIDARTPTGVVRTADAPLAADLDALPPPRTDDLDLGRYDFHTAVTARGCAFRCAFCEIPGRQRGCVRRRSVAAVVDELAHAHDRHGIRFVAFQDDDFLAHRARVRALLDGLERRGVHLRWACFGRAGAVDADWLRELRGRGLERIALGVEAGADRLLAAIGKRTSLRAAMDGVAAATAVVATTCFFLWGFPDESLAEFFATAQAVHHAELLGAEVQVGQVVPLPGSALFARHGHALRFDEELPFCRIVRPPAHPELRALVREHPAAFPAFRSFETPDRETKWRLASGLCCR